MAKHIHSLAKRDQDLAWKKWFTVVSYKSAVYAFFMIIAALFSNHRGNIMSLNLIVAVVTLVALSYLRNRSRRLMIADASPQLQAIFSSIITIVCLPFIFLPISLRLLSLPPADLQSYIHFVPSIMCFALALLAIEAIDLRRACKGV